MCFYQRFIFRRSPPFTFYGILKKIKKQQGDKKRSGASKIKLKKLPSTKIGKGLIIIQIQKL